MLLLVNNLHEKHITEIQDGQNFGSVHMLFVFSQSDVHNLFMYIIRKCMYDLN